MFTKRYTCGMIKLALLLALLSFSGCACPVLHQQKAVEHEKAKLYRPEMPWNAAIWEVSSSPSWCITTVYAVSKNKPGIEFEAGTYHYEVLTITHKTKKYSFKIWSTYDDSEDGGNCYGWVEEDGMKVGLLVDGVIQKYDKH